MEASGRSGKARPPRATPAGGRPRAQRTGTSAGKGRPAPPKAPQGAGGRRGPAPDGANLERLQKILAHAGIASRRACEQLILQGHVQVNGATVTELGAKADPLRDEVTVDFRPVRKETPVYLLLNKPKGYVTTVKDDAGRPTVMALLRGIDARVYPVGRLDFQSEGLLLMTNDGALAQRLTDPDHEIPKVYMVKVHGMPTKEQLDELRVGFRLDGRRLKPCGIEVVSREGNPWLQVTLTEGKNLQIRRMFAAMGHPVHKLRRVQFGPVYDATLKPGEWRPLAPNEVAALLSL